ncbi:MULTISPECIES: hypothetical protein [unclassified Vibrio]|uniref:hypothetical protein n=1 Tax=unclassified Vibrio TaxID=2614977 RepID=UPI0029646323|nr:MULTISPECIES: hypothetical protein [unclassified Vibrio]MDW1637155.1 hypothetical protein [Vibrio sp. Vb2907]MDW1707928.1 hypothetical protein [Vibrio sp. Vb2917]MDW1722487.1 hypothetical protein [Vibrio sp. Vb2979]
MFKNPTDLELLECIYNHYRAEFALYDSDETIRAGKVYVHIDCRLIAGKLSADPELVFGRLYYHLANVYKYQQSKGVEVKLFEFEVDKQLHCIQFPVLASAVANLKAEHQRYKHTLIAAIFAVVVAVGAAAITAYDVFGSKT